MLELRERPVRLVILAGAFLFACLHQATHWDWYIDDAGIVFAYARNLATGEGLVPWPGGERIEAVSDPTWVGLLALAYLVGLDGFEVSKPLAMLFTAGTVWVTWRLARRALPAHGGDGALLAPVLLAGNAQFAIWSASGLENALFCLLLAIGMHRTLIEAETRGFPWAAVAYLGLVWTRPEGIAYAAVGLAVSVGASRAAGTGWGRPGAWLGILVVPSLVLEALRLWYFAWPLPNTFYAKIANRGVASLDWTARGWNQLRDWSDRLWHGYFAPIVLLGLTGAVGPRARVGLAVVAVLAASLFWPGTAELRKLAVWPDLPAPPAAWLTGRVVAFLAAGALLPLLAIGLPGGATRLLCGATLWVGLAFSIAVDGDWMSAYRFTSFVSVPLAVLTAAGLVELADRLEIPWGRNAWVAVAAGAGLAIVPHLSQTRDHRYWNRDETTASVKQRVDHTRAVARRTFWDGEIVNLEVDQGAHLWYAPDYHEVDMAMLVDIPMSRHWYQQRDFVREYVFRERDPTFAHVGGWWAKHTGFRRYEGWDDRYFELPTYLDRRPGVGWFRNVFARRDLVLAAAGGEVVARFGTVGLHEPALPAPWSPGLPGYLELPFSLAAPWKAEDALVIAFLAAEGRVVASFALPMGYGLLPMARWREREVFRGRHAVPVPEGLPGGRYDLGVVVFDRAGVVSAGSPPGGSVLAAGELLLPDAVEVVDRATLSGRIDVARDAVAAEAAAGRCEAAVEAWIRLRRHRPTDWSWHEVERPAAGHAIAQCYARLAEEQPERAAELLAGAHRWDHHHPDLHRVGEPVARRLLAEGHEARSRSDWETAYARYTEVLSFQPWRSWARRYAEEARDHRLGLVDDVRIGIGGEDDLREAEAAAAENRL